MAPANIRSIYEEEIRKNINTSFSFLNVEASKYEIPFKSKPKGKAWDPTAGEKRKKT